ncbi:hypothetical protein HW115_10400 [Verrucomicrobiaceae bacterium N1E253]|uniref:TPM domain-containing protein n=1 Tax=Oceaniferula marina TaxID=2748318 RepID=A0A851GEQ5_9BACT|nr:hypothetical protein [Oceaniferula marina]NWK56023.1 hypothetical protein [Oceaniferula marina]
MKQVVFCLFASFVLMGALVEGAGSNLKKSTSMLDHLEVSGVPREFMGLISSYVEVSSNDVPYPGLEEEKREAQTIIVDQIINDYPDTAEGYFLEVVSTNGHSLLRRYAYSIFFKTELNNGLMLDYAREALRARDWEAGVHLDYDIRNQLRVLVVYGDASDVGLWNRIWARMDDRERHSFKGFGEMIKRGAAGKKAPERKRMLEEYERGSGARSKGEEQGLVDSFGGAWPIACLLIATLGAGYLIYAKVRKGV